MIESEATTKWCPFARAPLTTATGDVVTGASVVNRRAEGGADAASLCLGAACMSWRWSEAKRTVAFLDAVQAHMKAQPKPNFNTAVQAVYAETGGQFERVEGGCGLAGAPS